MPPPRKSKSDDGRGPHRGDQLLCWGPHCRGKRSHRPLLGDTRYDALAAIRNNASRRIGVPRVVRNAKTTMTAKVGISIPRILSTLDSVRSTVPANHSTTAMKIATDAVINKEDHPARPDLFLRQHNLKFRPGDHWPDHRKIRWNSNS